MEELNLKLSISVHKISSLDQEEFALVFPFTDFSAQFFFFLYVLQFAVQGTFPVLQELSGLFADVELLQHDIYFFELLENLNLGLKR